jgi:hypothetical protein
MANTTDDEQPWMPEPVLADASVSTDISTTEAFAGHDGHANINRAPHDRISGVVFKRAANIRRVRYALGGDATEHATPSVAPEYQGTGKADVSWLFSEQPGSQEALLDGHTFRYLQDVELLPGASTEQSAHPERDTVLYIIAGEGRLLHRPSSGSPNLVRPLRPFDAVLIRGAELFGIANASDTESMRLLILALAPRDVAPRR